MGHGLRWIKYTAAILLGWAILWPALAETTRITGRELTQLASTSSDTGAVEPLVAGRTFGVSFICPEDGLSALEFRVATYQRINPARLVLLLYKVPPGLKVNPDPAARVPIRRVVIGAAGLNDWGPARFEFSPVKDSGAAKFYAVLTSPGTKVFQCVGLVMAKGSGSPSWQGYTDGESSPLVPALRLLGASGKGEIMYSRWWLMALVPAVVLGLGWLRRS